MLGRMRGRCKGKDGNEAGAGKRASRPNMGTRDLKLLGEGPARASAPQTQVGRAGLTNNPER